MESSRPWPWPPGASGTTSHVLGQVGLGLGLGLGKHVLDLDHFRLMCLVFTARQHSLLCRALY